MLRTVVAHSKTLLSCALALVLCAPAPADVEEKNAKSHEAHPVKYKVTIHDDAGKELSRSFDLASPEEVKELQELLAHGHIHHLQVDEPPDLFSIKGWDTGIWTVVVFVVLFFILYRYAWGPILEGLQKREDSIRRASDEAIKARNEAAELRERLQADANKASEQVREMLEEARRDAERAKAEMQETARKEIGAERERLMRDVETARDQALQALTHRTAELATLVSSRVLRRELNVEDQRRLVDEALERMDEAAMHKQADLAGR